MYRNFFKRILDFSVAFLLLFLLSPLLLFATIGLFVANSGKPFFLQQRPGKDGEIFTIVKFKTMNDTKDKNGDLLSDAERLTPIGRFVRKTSLDELPQLFNVLKGDMSLIGPRPLLVQYLPLYNEQQRKRHNVRPGITGWAQVNGRNAISWQQKFEYDVWYTENIALKLDVLIVLKTIQKVIKREGIAGEAVATAEPFKGN